MLAATLLRASQVLDHPAPERPSSITPQPRPKAGFRSAIAVANALRPFHELDPLPYIVDGGYSGTAELLPGSVGLLDVGTTGLALQVSHAFARNATIDVTFSDAAQERSLTLSGCVARCEAAKEGGFRVICRLERPLSPAELKWIGSRLFAMSLV